MAPNYETFPVFPGQEVITFTSVKAPNGWLSNMAPYPLYYDEQDWKTSEALFQALRFEDRTIKELCESLQFPMTFGSCTFNSLDDLPATLSCSSQENIRQLIRECKSPMSAKMMAKKYRILMTKNRYQGDTSFQDLKLMIMCLRLKLEQHPGLQDWLLATGDAIIIENCSNRSHSSSARFWGAVLTNSGEWQGKNWLGVLWTILRDKLRRERSIHNTAVQPTPELLQALQRLYVSANKLSCAISEIAPVITDMGLAHQWKQALMDQACWEIEEALQLAEKVFLPTNISAVNSTQ